MPYCPCGLTNQSEFFCVVPKFSAACRVADKLSTAERIMCIRRNPRSWRSSSEALFAQTREWGFALVKGVSFFFGSNCRSREIRVGLERGAHRWTCGFPPIPSESFNRPRLLSGHDSAWPSSKASRWGWPMAGLARALQAWPLHLPGCGGHFFQPAEAAASRL